MRRQTPPSYAQRVRFGFVALAFAIVGAPAVAAPTQLTVTCTDAETQVSTSAVQVAADGVHVTVVQGGSSSHDLQIQDTTSAVYLSSTQTVPYVVDVAPGSRMFTCFDPDDPTELPGTPGFAARSVAIDVVDPAGLWVPVDLQCADGGQVRTFVDPPAIVDPRRLMFALRVRTWGIRATDVLGRAGYPTARSPFVRVRRSGRTVAVARYSPVSGGRYVLGSVVQCQSLRDHTVAYAGASRGISVRITATSPVGGSSVVVSVNRRSAPVGTLAALRTSHVLVCRTPRGVLTGGSRMSSIDTAELLFVRRTGRAVATGWRCELRSGGRVIRRFALSQVN